MAVFWPAAVMTRRCGFGMLTLIAIRLVSAARCSKYKGRVFDKEKSRAATTRLFNKEEKRMSICVDCLDYTPPRQILLDASVMLDQRLQNAILTLEPLFIY